MATAPTSISGLASGIDWKSIISSLVSADRAGQNVLRSKSSVLSTKLSAVQALNTRMLALRDANDELRQASLFTTKTVTSSNADALAVSSDATAVTGNHTISVENLASTGQVASASKNIKTGHTVGNILLKLAGSNEVTITNTATDLDGMAASINAANAGVSASVINDGSGYRLMVRSAATGAQADIQYIKGADPLDNVFQNGAGVDASLRVTTGVDATLRLGGSNGVGGLLVNSATNTFTGVIPGVTLTAKSTTNARDLSITIGQDSAGIRSKLQTMVDAYNSAFDYLKANGSYDAASKKAGPLFTQSSMRRVLNDALTNLTGSVDGQATGYKNLADLGVKLGNDGRLTFTASTFDDKLKSDPTAVKTLVTSIAGTTYTALNTVTEPTNGVFAGEITSINNTITDINKRLAAMEAQLAIRQERYQSQFLRMESTISNLKNMGSRLGFDVSSKGTTNGG